MRRLVPTDPASVAAEERKAKRELEAKGIVISPVPVILPAKEVKKVEKKIVEKKVVKKVIEKKPAKKVVAKKRR